MKLLVQSDDYAITPGVSLGCIEGIRHGLIRNTGMFVNMPWSKECFTWIAPYLDRIALGIDLNLTTGAALLAHSQIPSLTKEDGSFYSSKESYLMDKQLGREHGVPEEIEREFRAQLARFESICQRKPAYIHAHAYYTPTIKVIQQKLAKEWGIPYSGDVLQTINGAGIEKHQTPWYQKPATIENQMVSSLKDYLLNDPMWLQQEAYVLIGHMGYVDPALLSLSSYTLYRIKDLEAVCDAQVKAWLEAKGVKLITYHQLNKEEN